MNCLKFSFRTSPQGILEGKLNTFIVSYKSIYPSGVLVLGRVHFDHVVHTTLQDLFNLISTFRHFLGKLKALLE